MPSLFNYNTLKVSLKKDTKTLLVHLNRPSKKNAINMELIFELDSLLAWTSTHLEIYSVVITGQNDIFSVGHDLNDLNTLGEEKIFKLLTKIQKLVYTMFFMPQTIIMDLKEEAGNIAAELAIGADIRIANSKTVIHFDHISKGLVPCCGGIGFLNLIVPHSYARKWSLSAQPIKKCDLINSGYCHDLYDKDDETDVLNHYLTNIANQSPVARIQGKRSLLESILPEIDRALDYEKKFAFAGMSVKDWEAFLNKDDDQTRPDFSSPRELAIKLKEETLEKIRNDFL